MTRARDLRHMADVIRVLVGRDQKARYTNTAMGVVWAVAAPVLFLMTFYLMFKVILPLDVPNYASHLFVGLVVWAWFQGTVTESVGCIVGNPGAVNQPRFPVAALPVASAVSNFVTLCLTLPVLVVILWFEGARLDWAMLALPLLVLCQFVFVLAVAFGVAAANVRFRDLAYIVPIMLQLGYFVTPIFYDAAALPETARGWLALNPMLVLMEGYRAVLIRGEWPDFGALALVFVGSLLLLVLAVAYFRQAKAGFLEEL